MVEEEQVLDEVDAGEDEEAAQAAKLKEAIEVAIEEIGTLRKKLTITVPQEIIDERRTDQYGELKRDAMVPGFRKGRAPLRLIEKRFGAEVGDQLLGQLVGGSFMAAVEKTELKTLGDPLVWVTAEGDGSQTESPSERLLPLEKALDHLKLPAEGAMTFACEVELRPEFELPELAGIAVERPKVEISDDDVSAEIDRFRATRGRYVPVSAAIVEDDMVIADMTMTIDGTDVRQEKNHTVAARAQRVEGVSLDLGKVMVGKKAGDTVSVAGSVDDDHENAEWRGKSAAFSFAIQDVKRLELPEMDGEFLETLGIESLDELRDSMRSNLEIRLSSTVKRGMRGQIQKHLLEKTNVEVPEGLSKRQADRLAAKRQVELSMMGVPQATVEKHLDEMRTRASQDALNELKLFFIMEKIAEQMDIDVSEHEVNGAIGLIAQQQGRRFDRVRDDLAKSDRLMSLYLQLRDEKILDGLIEKAKITEVEGPKKKTAAKTETKKKTAAKPKATKETEPAAQESTPAKKSPRQKKDSGA